MKLLGGVLGDGYIGYAHLDALNAEYLGDAIETIHSFGGWQWDHNYFGPPGATNATTGKIDTYPVPARLQLWAAVSLPAGVLG